MKKLIFAIFTLSFFSMMIFAETEEELLLKNKISPTPKENVQPKNEVKPQPKPSPYPNSKPSPYPNSKPSPKVQSKPNPHPNSKPSPYPQAKSQPKPLPAPQYKPLPKPHPKPQTKPSPKPYPENREYRPPVIIVPVPVPEKQAVEVPQKIEKARTNKVQSSKKEVSYKDEIDSFFKSYRSFVKTAKKAYEEYDTETMNKCQNDRYSYEDTFNTLSRTKDWTKNHNVEYFYLARELELYLKPTGR